MVLLERFHAFLLNALAEQYRARAELNREVEQRIAAQQRTDPRRRAAGHAGARRREPRRPSRQAQPL